MRVLPGLSIAAIDRIHADLEGPADVKAIRDEFARIRNPQREWPAFGGVRVEDEWLTSIADRVRDIAERSGYPDQIDGRPSAFDTDVAIFLFQQLSEEVPLGQCLREEFWAYLAASVLPDVSVWRFPNIKKERLLGRIRNVFRRLWWRAFLLGRPVEAEDRWQLLREMTEDALVSLTERPSISANPELARAFGEGWVRAAEMKGSLPMEKVARTTAKFLRARNVVVQLDALEETELARMVDETFALAIASLEKEYGKA